MTNLNDFIFFLIETLMISCWTRSCTKWRSIWICFILECYTGLNLRWVVSKLLHKREGGSFSENLIIIFSNLVNITIGCNWWSWVFLDLDAMKYGVFEITKKPISCCLMSDGGLMHKLWELVHKEGDVWTGQWALLQVSNYSTVLCAFKCSYSIQQMRRCTCR